MNNTGENDFFGFPKVKRVGIHLTGEEDKPVRCSCQIFPGCQKSLKSVNF